MPLNVPVDAIQVTKPDADWPPHIDFMQTMAGILTMGLDLQREPIDVKFSNALAGRNITVQGLQIKKGFKRITAALYILKHCMTHDPDDPALDCMANVLLRLRDIPIAYTEKANSEGHTFDYIMLSNRQSLRQRLSPLQLSFILDNMVLDRAKASGDLMLTGVNNKKERLFQVIEDYNKQPGVRDVKPLQISPEERWALCNINIGLSETCKTLLRIHLNRFKWTECALTRDHCRSQAWLLGNSSAGAGAPVLWKELLTVTPPSQELFLTRYLEQFVKIANGKRTSKQKSGRINGRLSLDDFNMSAGICALYLNLEQQFKENAAMDASKKDHICTEKRRMFEEGCPY